MATKRKTKKVVRRKKGSTAPAPRRRKRRTLSESPFSLAETLDISKPDSGIRVIGEGAMGAGAGALLLKGVSDPALRRKYLALLGLGLLLMKKPIMAAGVAGVLAFDMLATPAHKGMREEDIIFFDPDALGEDEPLVLDQYGNPLVMSDGSAPEDQTYIPDYLGNAYYSR